jgi:hypothetical protein
MKKSGYIFNNMIKTDGIGCSIIFKKNSSSNSKSNKEESINSKINKKKSKIEAIRIGAVSFL